MNSSPFSKASTGLWTITFGMPGIAWVTMSSRLGSTAEVIATESPSQPKSGRHPDDVGLNRLRLCLIRYELDCVGHLSS